MTPVWPYLVVFSEAIGTREQVQEFLDSLPEVTYWYACLPNCVFFTATVAAGQISSKFKDKFGTEPGKRFLVTEIAKDRQGWLPKNVWHMFKNPEDPRVKNAE